MRTDADIKINNCTWFYAVLASIIVTMLTSAPVAPQEAAPARVVLPTDRGGGLGEGGVIFGLAVLT